LVIIFSVVWMSLKNVDLFDNRAILFVVSLAASILAVRYMIVDNNFFRAILLPYGALGASISMFIPLFIYFMFVHTAGFGGFGRRAAWVLYLIIFLFLWGSQPYMGAANWIIVAAFAFIIVSVIFDKTLHGYFQTWQLTGSTGQVRRRLKREAKMDMIRLEEARAKGAVTDAEYRREARDIRRRHRNF